MSVTFDIRGAGKSLNFDDSEDVFSFEKYSEDLNHLLRHLKIGKFNLWSMAGVQELLWLILL